MIPLKIFIEEKPAYQETRLYVFYTDNNGFTVEYRMKDDKIIAERLEPTPEYREPKPFLVGPPEFIHSLAHTFAAYLETKGGTNHEQFNKGRIQTLTEETDWLRGLIERQLK